MMSPKQDEEQGKAIDDYYDARKIKSTFEVFIPVPDDEWRDPK